MDWLLAFHIIGLIVWMGGLVTLARLIGHHSGLEGADVRASFVRFERRSYLAAVLPGFLLTLGTGLTMLLFKGDGIGHYLNPTGPWGATFHVKLTIVAVIIVLDQLIFAKMRKLHREDVGNKGFFMATHGIIGLLFMIVIVLVKTNLLG